jgi:hypothetical protein
MGYLVRLGIPSMMRKNITVTARKSWKLLHKEIGEADRSGLTRGARKAIPSDNAKCEQEFSRRDTQR